MSSGGWTCAGCGGANPAGTRFCGHCGTPAAVAPESAKPPPAPASPAAAPPPAPAPATERSGPGEPAADLLRSFVATSVADRLVESGGRLTEERRLVTALFADLSGFTTLAGQLETEQLLEVIDPVIAGLTGIVGRYDGYVEKFAGDALLALFGAPVTHEDDAERAVRVALEMHATLPRLTPPGFAGALTLHVGINTGHVIARVVGSEVRMDYAVLGDAVILAQRLESHTPAGETYVGEPTAALVRGRYDLAPVGPFVVKGRDDPLPAWRVVAALPAATGAAQPLVGRAPEATAATSLVGFVTAGSGGALAVTGEPGVGKTRLLAEVAAHAAVADVRWLEGPCVSYGAALPYRPWGELLRGHLGLAPGASPQPMVERLGAELAALGVADATPYLARLLGASTPDLDAALADLEPEAVRRGIHDAVARWLHALAAAQPTVVVLEDVHWADPASVSLARQVVAGCRGSALGVCITARPSAGSVVDEILADAPSGGCVRVALDVLDDAAVAELIRLVLSGSVTPRLATAVGQHTGGNPFFVRELIRALHESGDVVRTDDGWDLRRGWQPGAVPETVEGVLAARMDQLPRGLATLLQTAAVVGRRVPLPVLRLVSGAGATVDAAVAELVDAGFLDPAAGGDQLLAFHHGLVQEVAYDRMLRRHRRALHGRVAEAVETLYGAGDDSIDLLARHLYLAEAGERAARALARAGVRAKRLFANEEAGVHLERAAEVARTDAPDLLADVLLELADLRDRTGDYEPAAALYAELCARTNDVRGWAGRAATLRRRGRYDDALAVLAEARRAGASGDQRLLVIERAYTLSVAGRLAEAAAAGRAGLGPVPADRVDAQLLLRLANIARLRGQLPEAIERAQQAARIFEATHDVTWTVSALRSLGDLLARQGDAAAAATALRRGLELAERTGNVEEIGGCLVNLGLLDLNQGSYAAAAEYNRRALAEFGRVGHLNGQIIASENLAECLMWLGRLDEAVEFCDATLEMAQRTGDVMAIADVTNCLALIRARQGRHAEAAEIAQHAAAMFSEAGAADFARGSLDLAASEHRAAVDLAAAPLAGSV